MVRVRQLVGSLRQLVVNVIKIKKMRQLVVRMHQLVGSLRQLVAMKMIEQQLTNKNWLMIFIYLFLCIIFFMFYQFL